MRITAGICVLAAGLLFGAGGGAIAGADSDPSSSSGPSQGADGSSQGSNLSTGPGSTSTDTNTKVSTLSEDTDPTGSGQGIGDDEPATTPSDEETGGVGTDEQSESETTPDSGAGTEPDTTVTTPDETSSADSTSTSGDSSAATTEPVDVSTPEPLVAPVDPAPPVPTVFSDWANAFSTLPGVLPAAQAPIAGALASVEALITSITGVVAPLAEIPGDLYALLGATPPTLPPPLIGAGPALDGVPAFPVPADAPLFGPLGWHVAAPMAQFDNGSLFGTMAPRPALGAVVPAGLSLPLAVSGTVPLKMGAPMSARSIFEHVVEAVLVPASLTALAALALPGVGGLLVVAAAGVRLGYRQAKAGLALRASGIARFAGPGPLGVVRSGSLVTLRQRARGPRTTRAVCPEASRSARFLEPVA